MIGADPAKNTKNMRRKHEGKLGGMLDPLETKQIHGSKSTKHHQTNKSQKKLGAIVGGEFSDLGRKQQNQARKRGVGAPKT